MTGFDGAANARRYDGPGSPALDRLSRVAAALSDDLRRRVVFIGGSVTQLVATDHLVFESSRPTKDVDAIVATTSYPQKAKIEEELRALKFRHDTGSGAHADRWRLHDGTIFDLVSCGSHLGGSGNEDDEFAVTTAEVLDLPPLIRHVSGVGFLLLKCGAFQDRGLRRPLESKDLMDLVALLAGRPELPAELTAAPAQVQSAIKATVLQVLETAEIRAALSSHIRDRGPLADDVEDVVIRTLRTIIA